MKIRLMSTSNAVHASMCILEQSYCDASLNLNAVLTLLTCHIKRTQLVLSC